MASGCIDKAVVELDTIRDTLGELRDGKVQRIRDMHRALLEMRARYPWLHLVDAVSSDIERICEAVDLMSDCAHVAHQQLVIEKARQRNG